MASNYRSHFCVNKPLFEIKRIHLALRRMLACRINDECIFLLCEAKANRHEREAQLLRVYVWISNENLGTSSCYVNPTYSVY